MTGHHITLSLCAFCLMGFTVSASEDDLLKVHECGTFTSFQDEEGNAFSHINTDDEPVPKFVHQLFYEGRFSPTEMPPTSSKGVIRAHPAVTMRLETPVTYFHLPRSTQELTLDVSVEFQGGWLTEFFPRAETRVNGRNVRDCKKEKLETSTVGRLLWKGIHLGGRGEGPQTEDRVWLAPRQVNAAQVTAGNESERFLFYRGVGHRDAPLRIVRRSTDDQLELISASSDASPMPKQKMTLSQLWLAEITTDNRTAFRSLPDITLDGQRDQFLAETSAKFSEHEFSSENTGKLRSAMHVALVEQGLFDDEARAMLNTWELSYFRSPGLRLFFLLPQTWTDGVLPFNLSVPAEVTRVMVGRIELVTPKQRELLKRIARLPLADLKQVSTSLRKLQLSSTIEGREKYNALASGRGDSEDLGVPVPGCYQAFLDLGRFRTSLLLSEKQPSRALANFALEIQAPSEGYRQYLLQLKQNEVSEKKRPENLRLLE